MLYRGVSQEMDKLNNGCLVAKGNKVQTTAHADGETKADGTFFAGPCIDNTARAHQIKSGLYNGCGVSTTRSEEIAIYFATAKFENEKNVCKVDGYVYVIDESKLAEVNVSKHEFPDPLFPDEKEVTLIEHSGNSLPNNLVIQKYAVNNQGQKIP
jgi:hypothetical protein